MNVIIPVVLSHMHRDISMRPVPVNYPWNIWRILAYLYQIMNDVYETVLPSWLQTSDHLSGTQAVIFISACISREWRYRSHALRVSDIDLKFSSVMPSYMESMAKLLARMFGQFFVLLCESAECSVAFRMSFFLNSLS